VKHLFPAITCLLTAHRKPTLGEALASAIDQTRRDVQILVVDSGQWMLWRDDIDRAIARAYADYSNHPMVDWVFTGEAAGAAKSTCMVAKVFNEALRAGIMRGQYVCTFYDDDLYYPTFFEKMAGWLDNHPTSGAVRCSEQWTKIDEQGLTMPVQVLHADRAMSVQDHFDNVVDGMQVMFRMSAIMAIIDIQRANPSTYPDPYEVIPQAVDTCRHSDGLFFEKLKHVIGEMGAIDEILCEHRFTPFSTFTPYAAMAHS
jgi:hypothetical protein